MSANDNSPSSAEETSFFRVYDQLLTRQQYDLIVDALIDQFSQQGQDEYDAVEQSLLLLEKIVRQDPETGLPLLAELYPKADAVYAHTVKDAIDLWLYEQSNSRIETYLTDRIQHTADAEQMDAYQHLLAVLRSRRV